MGTACYTPNIATWGYMCYIRNMSKRTGPLHRRQVSRSNSYMGDKFNWEEYQDYSNFVICTYIGVTLKG